MLIESVERVVAFSRRFALLVATVALLASVGLGAYVAATFRINTDVNQLLAEDLDWRQREREIEQAFPQRHDRLVVVVDAPTDDAASLAAGRLAEALRQRPDLFTDVTQPDAIPFFRKNGLLFLDRERLAALLEHLIQAQPLLGALARDPSLRGLLETLGLLAEGAARGEMDPALLDSGLARITDSVRAGLDGNGTAFPWRILMGGETPGPGPARAFLITRPVLDYAALAPGAKASAAVREAAQTLGLAAEPGVRVRLTGSVALNDEEFASVAEGAQFATTLSVVLVLAILFLALRSFRLILPILLTLVAGLVATTALAMAAVGSLNLISVAFAVMFVGIAVDFGIQFGVRYRDQRHQDPDSRRAMLATARIIAQPLALAAGSTAVGFFAFIPTDYRGVAELGLIAGAGMLIAFALNITLLPALLRLFHPPAEPEAIGWKILAPLDRFLVARRRGFLIAAGALALVALPFALRVPFDVDPLNMKDPRAESVATLFDLMKSPRTQPYVVEILAPSLDEAKAKAARLAQAPRVDHVLTLASFVPEDQDAKRALLADAAMLLMPTLAPPETRPAPDDAALVAAFAAAAAKLRGATNLPHAPALATLFDSVATRKDPALLRRLEAHFLRGLLPQLESFRLALEAPPVTESTMTDDVRRDWIAADGRARMEVHPKAALRDADSLRAFTESVRAVAPEATGMPVSIQESGRTVTQAFLKAGILALLAVALLAGLVLRGVGDVLRLLAPLVLAGILTLATLTLTGQPLTFANIIALPLLLSLGVSYAIYFVSYARAGQKNPLQSSMARAVLFSAATTLVAFGTLFLSSHPGTSGMGGLLTIALLYSVVCTFLVLPALHGRPRSG